MLDMQNWARHILDEACVAFSREGSVTLDSSQNPAL